MFRVAAGAGLTVTLGLVTAAALAGPAAASPVTRTAGGGLPVATSQCDPAANPPQGITKVPAPQKRPWAQQSLDYSAAWQYSRGAGVKVGVIDSGVDANSQFGNRVITGRSFVPTPSGQAGGDCVGHGTMVAGIIGAGQSGTTKFAGVAPGATIESYKVASTDKANIQTSTIVQAIGQAINDGCRVINISIATTGPSQQLQNVITAAYLRNIVVVVASGNDTPAQPATGSQPAKAAVKGPFFPASDKYVLSVGATTSAGALGSFSDRVSHTGVAAPGQGITSTFPSAGTDAYAQGDGTSFAAPFVSGLAALIISRDPGISAQQVISRIEDTADGNIGAGSGNGIINPVQALTAQLPQNPAPVQSAAPARAVTIDRNPTSTSELVLAYSVGGGALLVVIAVIAASVIIPAGRRRNWRPGEPA